MSIKLRKRKISGGRYSYYLDIYHKGKRSTESLDLYTDKSNRSRNKEIQRLAETLRAKRQLEIVNNENGLPSASLRNTNFVEYFENITLSKRDGEVAWPNTLKILKEYTKSRCTFADIDKNWVIRFKNHLLNVVYVNTAHLYYSKFKAALNQAVKDEIILSNPAHKVDGIERKKKIPIYLVEQEVQKLAQTPCGSGEIRRAFLFGCQTGLRISDIKNLKWENVKSDELEFEIKKTEEIITLPLSKTAQKLLSHSEVKNEDDSVFELPHRNTINKVLKQWTKDAGISKHVTFHVSRHTFGTQSITSGIDLYTLKDLMGHKSLESTQIYAQIINPTKRKAINKLPVIKLGEVYD